MAKIDIIETPIIKSVPRTKDQPIAEPAQPGTQPAAAAPSPEQLKDAAKDLYGSMGWGDAPAIEVPAEVTAQPSAQPTAEPAAAAPAPEPEPEPEPEPQPVTEPAIRRIVGEAMEDAVDRLKPATETAAATDEQMSPEDVDDLKVIRFLAGQDPRTGKARDARFVGKAEKFVAYVKALAEYRKKWETDHEGEEFDINDESHEKWIAANYPDIDTTALERGRQRLIAVEEYEAINAPIRMEQQQRQAFAKAGPTVARIVSKRIGEFVAIACPEMAKLLMKDGKYSPTDEMLQSAESAEPIAFEVLNDIVECERALCSIGIRELHLGGISLPPIFG